MKRDEWRAFFNQKGWKIFYSELQKSQQDANALLRSASSDDLYRAQGIACTLDDLIAWPENKTRREDGDE